MKREDRLSLVVGRLLWWLLDAEVKAFTATSMSRFAPDIIGLPTRLTDRELVIASGVKLIRDVWERRATRCRASCTNDRCEIITQPGGIVQTFDELALPGATQSLSRVGARARGDITVNVPSASTGDSRRERCFARVPGKASE